MVQLRRGIFIEKNSLFKMKNIFTFALFGLLVVQIESNIFRNRFGDCAPLTVEFIASLVTQKARQLLDLNSRQRALRFDLYTKLNLNERQVLRTGDKELLFSSNFNASWPVRLSLHGWNGQTVTCSNAAIKDAYLSRGDFNVILVDWSDYSLDINYFRVINEMFRIADQLNAFTKFLHRETAIAFEDIYLIGHSLGCHLAGIAGKRLKPHKYGVIYALDTAGPIVSLLEESWRLAPTDALYVESIQTDLSLFGFRTGDIAHASFYPNWGLGQPHCPNKTTMEPDFVCDHFGSLYYFVESIRNSNAFGAFRCENYQSIELQKCGCGHRKCPADVFMGGEPASPKRGIYYLSTRTKQPFGYGKVCFMKRPLDPTTLRLKSWQGS